MPYGGVSDEDKTRPYELSALLLIIGIHFVILFYQIKMAIKRGSKQATNEFC